MNLPDFFHIPAAELAARSPVPLTLLPDSHALHHHFARAIADEIAANNAAGRTTRIILPVGPVGHYPLLVALCNEERISWQACHLFFMDEYCDWQGRWVADTHPLSFRGFARRELLERLDPALAPPPEHVHFPDPRALDAAGEAMAAVGGVDTCYGGLGVHGHVAFNEAQISRWYDVSVEEYRASRARLLPLAAETVVLNGTRAAFGYFPSLPPMAVTLGMAELYAARRVRLYCNGGDWQRAILRIACFGSPRPQAIDGEDVHYPVTLLRRHADFALVADTATAQPPIPTLLAR